MLFCINKYFRARNKKQHRAEKNNPNMPPPADVSDPSPSACIQGCCLSLVESNRRHPPTSTTTTRASRSEFTAATVSSLLSNTFFTNHESLPSFADAFSNFTATYPEYAATEQADRIRDHEYYHLAGHTCLDYTGYCLFSHAQLQSSYTPSSSARPPPARTPSFTISYKSASLKSQIQYGSQGTAVESSIRKRIMDFLNISEEEYSLVCTANRTTAFRLLAECYPFHANRRLLTVYDYESEEVSAMTESAQKRGAKVHSASFSWPSLRIHSAKLKKIVVKKNKNNKKRGLFVFPLQSRMTGTRYPYLWMSLAQENGWHVVLDTCALGPKDMDTLGLSLIQPDFIVGSFFKVFGENPAGFASLFIKKSSSGVLETSTIARSIGIVSIIPAKRSFLAAEDNSGTDSSESFQHEERKPEREEPISEIVELENAEARTDTEASIKMPENVEIEFRGLDHADSMGLQLINCRLRYIVNWLVNALLKLRHPNVDRGHPLVRIYGPKIKFDRGPSVAFNVFDWKGEKVEPALVQKLADRSGISLTVGFLQHIWFADKYEEDRNMVLERRICEINVAGNRRKETVDLGITVVNASLGFLTNFEDAYRLWSFAAKFLDADFVEKERWRYKALNQKMIEV